MKAAIIEGYTHILGKPKDWDEMTTEACGALHVRVERLDHTATYTSAWMPSDEEIAAMMHGAPVLFRSVDLQPAMQLYVGDVSDIAHGG